MWKEFTNISKIKPSLYRPMNGVANELIAIGRILKAGFFVAKTEIRELPYDAIIVLGPNRSLRVQIKGSQTGTVSFEGGGRSGKQQKKGKEAVDRKFKYSKIHCDMLIAIDGNNGDCYIVPVEELKKYKKSATFKKLENYKERWDVLMNCGND